jgi:predicted MFS family arabinose efflux permease
VASTGTLVAIQLLPRLLLSSAAGVLADRWDRRLTMVGADLFRAVLLLAILLPAAGGPLWIVYVVALLEVSAAQLFLPAEGALLPAIVRNEGSLMAANSILTTSMAVTKLAGPPLGGLLFLKLGLAGSAVVDSASFLLSALGILAVRATARASASTPTVPEAQGGFLAELREGVTSIASDRLVKALVGTIAIVMISQGMLNAVMVPFVRGVLHFDAVQFGMIAAAQGVGSLLAALSSGALSRYLTSGKLVGVALLLASAFLTGFTFARSLALSAAFAFLLSAPMVVAAVWTETYYQQRIADRLLGRVLGVAENLAAAGILLGVVIASVMGVPFGPLGPVAVLLLGVGVLLVASALALLLLRHATTRPPPVVSEEPVAAVYAK